MARRYGQSKSHGHNRATASRAEARANRKLQLIVNNTHAVEPGRTLIQQMEDRLDDTFKVRATLQQEYEEKDTDEAYDQVLKSEGKIQGMLEMLAIMRSTTKRTELERSKTRRHHGVRGHSTEN